MKNVMRLDNVFFAKPLAARFMFLFLHQATLDKARYVAVPLGIRT